MIHLRVVKRSEGSDNGYAKCLGAANEAAGQNAPGALVVTNAYGSGEAVDSDGELDAALENLTRESRWDLDTTRTPVMTIVAVRYVGPAFEENARAAVLFDQVQAAFKADKISL
jgi:hypothetical protein